MSMGYEQLLQAVAKNMREIRESCGLSQEALALNADVDRTYVSQIERGVANPSLRVLWQLAIALNVSASDLFREESSN
jgi:transcriptional regulator with XRE-family HTH domain